MKKKPTLVLLSDLWGFQNAEWLDHYQHELNDRYAIKLLDSRTLAGIDPSITEEQQIHHQFVHGGIDRAIQQLKGSNLTGITVLGFSIGGLIAWKAALGGLNVNKLVAISSTRLRDETHKPKTPVVLFYGEHDPYAPTKEWFNHLELQPNLLQGGHGIYKNKEFAQFFSKAL